MKTKIILSIVTCGYLLGTKLVTAEPTSGKCLGVLHQVKGEVLFGGAKGEGEGICIISKTELSRVLTTCHIGDRCIVEGIVDDCKDSGECTEITQVKSVRHQN
jgi:hypothetical protein